MSQKKVRSRNLVIVESPAKARTLSRFLGPGYQVRASRGHVRDLLRSKLSVDVNNDFAPTYRVPDKGREVVKGLKGAVKQAGEVYLATDPDREGEAIAWHLTQAIDMEGHPTHRVVFHEITESAVERAFASPRDIDMALVEAQQARRILDRLVGYQISPLLWRKVRRGLSAGRVQSVALRLVVERERDIQAFVPQEYWSIEAELAKRDGRGTFRALLERFGGRKVKLGSQAEAQEAMEALKGADYIVSDYERKDRLRHPLPPFTTSTLQQEASRRLGFGVSYTMRIAQELYEGVEIDGEGRAGLITYMRTDSVAVSSQAREEARSYIAQNYGASYLPPKARQYRTRSRAAQEAHEAIRPTSIHREPELVRKHLSKEQARLYELIWRRFLASQMASAILDAISAEIEAGQGLFRASSAAVKFPGFLQVYGEEGAEEEKPLPPLGVGEKLDLVALIPEQHFTQPPPRYTQASLVRALEENGIGRPSTYAPIISTIRARGYVEESGRRLRPSELGMAVSDLLVKHFPEIIDVGFTAAMEQDLDGIAAGEKERVPVLREFYGPFSQALARAEKEMQKVESYAGQDCELCGSPMLIKHGRFGKFIACSNFPTCRNTKPFLEKVGVKCPRCGGDLVQRQGRRRRIFYGCSNYPACDFTLWDRPIPEPCPECGGLMTLAGKERARCTNCAKRFSHERLEKGHAQPS